MADQRPSFRFRMPRLRPSVPPPRPTTAPEPPRTTTQPPAIRPPTQPQSIAPAPAAPAPAPTPMQAEAAPPPQADRSLPKPATAKAPESTKAEPQPSSPSQTGIIQSPVSSHPASPSRMSTQPRVSPKPPSPSHVSTRPQPTSQPSSPARVQPSQTASPPKSPSRLTSQPTNEVSSSPSSPIATATKVQPQEVLSSQPTQPSQPPSSRPESPQKPKLINGAQAPLREETRDDVSKFVSKTATSPPKQYANEKPVSVITLAGDNSGTSMHIGSGATKREIAIRIHRRYKVNPDESADTTTDGEESSKGKKPEKDLEATENQEKKAYINCNIQVINNSMVFNSSITEKSPGVHLGSSYNPENIKKPKYKNTESMDTHKAKVNMTPSQKLTYEPPVRRRCLRGLFMESSDSDPDDPEKPRRHGCRYICAEKSNKDDKTDVLGFK